MLNLVELNRIISEKKASKEFISRSLKITPRSLDNKLTGKTSFKGEEINGIAKILLLTDEQIKQIFFA